jgi:acyl-CoA synthetase (AMP-forming)/AMP-acid ligase II
VKELINRGGEKVSPHEVETWMARHGAIREVKVFGVPMQASARKSPPPSSCATVHRSTSRR